MDRQKRSIRRFLMAEGYCVKCKAKKEIADAVEEVMKNGRRAIKGRCPTCGVVMFKILGGKAVPPPAPDSPAGPPPAAAAPSEPPSPEPSAAS
jgi:hypothetical protein